MRSRCLRTVAPLLIGAGLVGALILGGPHLPLSVLRVLQQAGSTPPIPADAQRGPLGTPAPAPPGEGGFTFVAHQPRQPSVPVAYDRCRPIHVVVNRDRAPSGSGGLLREAMDEVSRATGLAFTIEGPTDELPRDDRPMADKRYGDRWSPVLIAWSTPAADPRLEGRVAGVGGSDARSGSGILRYVTGIVSLDAPDITEILQRPRGRQHARAIVMHELGHLVGLAHVDDPTQLMYEDNTGQVAFGDGDLRGLHQLGLGKCFLDS